MGVQGIGAIPLGAHGAAINSDLSRVFAGAWVELCYSGCSIGGAGRIWCEFLMDLGVGEEGIK